MVSRYGSEAFKIWSSARDKVFGGLAYFKGMPESERRIAAEVEGETRGVDPHQLARLVRGLGLAPEDSLGFAIYVAGLLSDEEMQSVQERLREFGELPAR